MDSRKELFLAVLVIAGFIAVFLFFGTPPSDNNVISGEAGKNLGNLGGGIIVPPIDEEPIKCEAKLYTHLDPYIGEDLQNADWRWMLANLHSNSTTGIESPTDLAGPILGVGNTFSALALEDDLLGKVDTWSYPNNYTELRFDGLVSDLLNGFTDEKLTIKHLDSFDTTIAQNVPDEYRQYLKQDAKIVSVEVENDYGIPSLFFSKQLQQGGKGRIIVPRFAEGQDGRGMFYYFAVLLDVESNFAVTIRFYKKYENEDTPIRLNQRTIGQKEEYYFTTQEDTTYAFYNYISGYDSADEKEWAIFYVYAENAQRDAITPSFKAYYQPISNGQFILFYINSETSKLEFVDNAGIMTYKNDYFAESFLESKDSGILTAYNGSSPDKLRFLQGDSIPGLPGTGPLEGQVVSVRIYSVQADGPNKEDYSADVTLLDEDGQERSTRTVRIGDYIDEVLTINGEKAIGAGLHVDDIGTDGDNAYVDVTITLRDKFVVYYKSLLSWPESNISSESLNASFKLDQAGEVISLGDKKGEAEENEFIYCYDKCEYSAGLGLKSGRHKTSWGLEVEDPSLNSLNDTEIFYVLDSKDGAGLGLSKQDSDLVPMPVVELGRNIFTNEPNIGYPWKIDSVTWPQLLSGSVNFSGQSIDFGEALVFGRDTPRVQTSLTSRKDEYQDQAYVETREALDNQGYKNEGMKYVFSFDDAIDLSQASENNPLQITFLGRCLKIVGSPTPDSILVKPCYCGSGDGEPQTHTVCLNKQCVTIGGPGVNQCAYALDCLRPPPPVEYHTECSDDHVCELKEGAGSIECSVPDGYCDDDWWSNNQ